MKNRHRLAVVLLVMIIVIIIQCGKTTGDDYVGKPFSDAVYQAGSQKIPGRIQCEYYDCGGEGIAYHDSDSTNSGSGDLNPSDGSYLNEFRKNEGVDISYTKIDERVIDNNPYNIVEPEKNQFYVGWTEPGEWTKYTVTVQQSGVYRIGMMYTSNRGGKISLAVDGREVTGPVDITTTFVQDDTITWRQWHHWNYSNPIAEIGLEKGLHVLTLATVAEGNMNYDFLEFVLKN